MQYSTLIFGVMSSLLICSVFAETSEENSLYVNSNNNIVKKQGGYSDNSYYSNQNSPYQYASANNCECN